MKTNGLIRLQYKIQQALEWQRKIAAAVRAVKHAQNCEEARLAVAKLTDKGLRVDRYV